MEGTTSLWRVHTALLVAQVLAGGGYFVITKVAPHVHGMHPLVLRLYRDVLAVLILFPAAFLFERRNPFRIPRSVLAKLLLLGLIGVFGSQMLLFLGNERTTSQFSLAMQPAIPVITAIMALLFGVEKLNLRRRNSRAKLAGTILSCAGAILIVWYRGPYILGESGFHFNWNLGDLCLIGNSLCIASFINLQATLLKQYPAPITVVAYCFLFGAIFMGVPSYFLVHDPSAWNVAWNADLIAVLYKGIISSALYFGLTSWALSKVGPLLVASYIPVRPVSSTVLAAIFFKGSVYLGSVLGTVMIIVGVLLVSWALEEAMRLAALSRIVEQSTRLPRTKAEPHDPELTTPLLQV